MRSCTKSHPEPNENIPFRMSSCSSKSLSQKLEDIDENGPTSWLTLSSSGGAPETPTESMEFLARSWSVSALELSKALSITQVSPPLNLEKNSICSDGDKAQDANSAASKESQPLNGGMGSPLTSPRDSEEMKLYKTIMKGRTMGRWLKDQKERKKQEIRTHNAHVHAAVSVAGVAAAVAALAASNAVSAELAANKKMIHSKSSAAMASAAALVASHCIEIAEDMGADREQIFAVVDSAVSARSNGDIMTLTAGAATALRGAATLKARLQKGYGSAAFALVEDKGEDGKHLNFSSALNFVISGGELLKRTRKGDLHWKWVSFNINSNWQVVAKMKSKYMAGTFTKKKKCAIFGIYGDVPSWPGREKDEFGSSQQRAYFGIKTADRTIEFECRNDSDKQMWILGVQYLLNCHSN